MSDDPDDLDAIPLAPFPTAIPASPFPPRQGETPVPGPPGQPVDADPPSDWIERADAHDLSVSHKTQRENALIALGRFAFPPEPAPGDDEMAARDRRWTSRIIAVATVFLLVFNAASIQNWSRQQPPGWVTATVQQLSDVWSAQLMQLGADQPRQTVRDAYHALTEARFGGPPTPPATPPSTD